MSYLVLARKYRPESFSTVSGQEHVTRTLGNAIRRNQVGHAYVLTGPRGVGKTSIARIFAKCLNCSSGPTLEPCLECANCREIAAGTSLAVREIDGASNNSVDNVRELIETFRTLPAPGSKYKVYIIDEVHMLSISAFNALLKSLEEPPPHTVFILATTEPHKIPDTVLSRCQRHDLRALPLSVISARILDIAKQEEFLIEPAAVKIIAKLADGSMRDAQTLLERARAYSEGDITAKDVSLILGTVDTQLIGVLVQQIFDQDVQSALLTVQSVFEHGADEVVFLREFVAFFRELTLVGMLKSDAALQCGLSEDEYEDLRRLAECIELRDLASLNDMAREGADRALRSSFPRFAIEALVARLASRPAGKDMGRIVARLREMVATQSGWSQLSSAGRDLPARERPSSEQGRGVSSRSASLSYRTKGDSAASSSDTPPLDDSQKKNLSHEELEGESVRIQAVPDNESLAGPLNFEDFVSFLGERGAVMLAELLKRVSVVIFEQGVLEVEGQDFQVKNLDQPVNVSRLTGLLSEFSAYRPWVFRVRRSDRQGVSGVAAAGSIVENDKLAEDKRLADSTELILNHESLRLVKQVFPGSQVGKVRLKRGVHKECALEERRI